MPFILWELGSRRYQLGLEFTADGVAYQQFDSIRYQIRPPGNQLLAAGTLPLRRGRVGRLPFQPSEPLVLERYLIRCATPARLRLGQPRQDLTGSFRVYAVDRAGRPTTLALDQVPLRYNKQYIVTLW
ncbi:hypothetical protein EJV47_05320 [Hymenobacter gummosus]|uniref:Uncharacterized protein n=1 Tax=Hymenobacter gummosus TaxID=1776032 RepID=A0A3S0HBP4_9BACT|nr:hypothetical protein [Hymenobacter gummosus]RTQ52434.1 hypothetical protein EJV47_05320 [Hymenobacter gummosus]